MMKARKHYYTIHLASLHLTHSEVFEQALYTDEDILTTETSTPTTLSECSDEDCDVCTLDSRLLNLTKKEESKKRDESTCVGGARRLSVFLKYT